MRVGIVGAGGMGGVHARQFRKMPEVELAIFDTDPDRATKLAQTHEARTFGSLAELTAWTDVVDICTPTPTHPELALQAIAAGRATLVEKPMALTLAEAHQVAEAAQKAGVPLMPAQVVRFFPDFRRGHHLVKSGTIGTPAAARTHRGGRAPGGAGGWFMDHTRSGGVIIDLAIHDLDWLRWTLGEVEQLDARSLGSQTNAGPDVALITLKFESGAVAHVEATWMDPAGFRTTFEVCGSEGMVEYDSRRAAALRTATPGPEPTAPRLALESPMSATDDPYYLQLSGFLTAVKAGSPPPVTAYDGLMACSLAVTALESARTGKTLAPPRP